MKNFKNFIKGFIIGLKSILIIAKRAYNGNVDSTDIFVEIDNYDYYIACGAYWAIIIFSILVPTMIFTVFKKIVKKLFK